MRLIQILILLLSYLTTIWCQQETCSSGVTCAPTELAFIIDTSLVCPPNNLPSGEEFGIKELACTIETSTIDDPQISPIAEGQVQIDVLTLDKQLTVLDRIELGNVSESEEVIMVFSDVEEIGGLQMTLSIQSSASELTTNEFIMRYNDNCVQPFPIDSSSSSSSRTRKLTVVKNERNNESRRRLNNLQGLSLGWVIFENVMYTAECSDSAPTPSPTKADPDPLPTPSPTTSKPETPAPTVSKPVTLAPTATKPVTSSPTKKPTGKPVAPAPTASPTKGQMSYSYKGSSSIVVKTSKESRDNKHRVKTKSAKRRLRFVTYV